MEWFDALNRALTYLEEHIAEPYDIEAVSKIALSSPFHFQRMFSIITGITVADYVRRRRLTLAAQDILAGKKVIDCALAYGYETPEAFTKAFRRMHGVSPTAARKQGVRLKAFPKLSFHISIKGEQDMNYRIIEKDAFGVIGACKQISNKDGENFKVIPKFWDELYADKTMDVLFANMGELGVMGICTNFRAQPDHRLSGEPLEVFDYLIAVEDHGLSLPGMTKLEIPAKTWAIFEAIGPIPDAIQNVWQRVFSEWFPATGYQLADGPELEIYYPGNPQDADYKSEVWIPIVKK